MTAILAQLSALASGKPLEAVALNASFEALLGGQMEAAQAGAFLMGLANQPISKDMLFAGASAMRAKMARVEVPFDCFDVCGTGGDGAHTLNVSTAVSFVLAGLGMKIAKHGNRAMSSKSGAGDVLEALGAKLTNDAAVIAKCLADANIAFLFAQHHHPAMAHVGPIRRALGFRTIFNFLGPMSNPVGVKRQIIGVSAPEAMMPMAAALADLGASNVWVLHGDGGVDEAVLHGPTKIVALNNGAISELTISPDVAGLPPAPLSAIVGGDAAFNGAALTRLLAGEKGAYRDAVLFNAAAALVCDGRADDLADAVKLAAIAIDEGKAASALAKLISLTNEAGAS